MLMLYNHFLEMDTRLFDAIGRLWLQIRHRGHLVDTVTGLSDKEKKLIKDSKEILLARHLETGADILLKFFEKYPQYLELHLFRDVPLEELKSNKAFLEQSTKLMSSIELWIEKLSDPEELRNILVKAGEEESKYPKQYLLDFKEYFIEYLNPLMDKKTMEAWKKMIEFATKTMLTSVN